MWRRAVRRVLELVVAIALLVFIFVPGTHTGLRYLMAAVVVLFVFHAFGLASLVC
jgi:hypothetical protein